MREAEKSFAATHQEFQNEDQRQRLKESIRLAQQNLLRLQHPGGYWCGELLVDSTLCSDYVLYMHWADKVDPVLQEKCVQHILRRQLPEGGWNIYEGGPSEINATIKAYFALKLAGHSPQSSWMQNARAVALRLGGIPRMNTYAKLYLALLGQFPWKHLPTIPAEVVLFPKWLFFNLYEMSSWSRAMIIPLAILNHFKPTRQLPAEQHLHELYPAGMENKDLSVDLDPRFFTWRNFFLRCDDMLKRLDILSWQPFRKRALANCERWMLERMGEGCDGLAAVYPAMLNAIMALKTLGYSDDDPALKKAVRDFEGLFVDDPQDFRIQPCLSPVWDTAITLIAMLESGFSPESDECKRAAQWLLGKEVRVRRDWAVKNPYPEASGWAFEFNNTPYPDTDDTMMVLMGLRLAMVENPDDLHAVISRAVPWLLSFQCKDGGWAAFDKDVMQRWLEDVPFADHNAILDPTCSDLTSRMLEFLGYIGYDRESRVVKRAIQFLKDTQEDDGSWYGRWGVNYIYGTWQVLRGLRAIGANMQEDWIVRARVWIESCQNDDGGWGESCATYDDPSLKGKGESTPSQTAWALMGLCAASEEINTREIERGAEYLMQGQNRDGSWDEPQTTGTGFPKVFYLKYDMYRNNFPLLALATYANYRAGIFHQTSLYQYETEAKPQRGE